MYPIIISAPHAQSKISDKIIRNRIRLSDYEIWKCSDPFSGQLKEFTCAWHKEIGKTHRLLCDLNRAPNENAFHKFDFFHRKVFKHRQGFSKKEKQEILKKYWLPYHDTIATKILELDSKNPPLILVIEYHNTSGDHPLNKLKEYMPGIILSNLGAPNTGARGKKKLHTSMPASQMKFLKNAIYEALKIPVEINQIFHGGYNTKWLSQLHYKLKTKAKIYAVQIEYNLDFVFNPISKKTDKKAMKIMQKAINKAIIELYKHLLKELH
jgi:N-formylglutamate amidohydrolase